MLSHILRRVLQSFGVLAAMSLAVFAGVYAVGNPVDILVNPQADQNEIARATAALGLDRPLIEQYFVFIKHAATGDLGRSFAFNVPAIGLILERMPATIELATTAMLIAVLLGIPLGLWAGLKPRSAAGRTIMAGSILGFSLPSFWVGLMLILVFSVWLGWLPTSGRGPTANLLGIPVSFLTLEGLRHLVLPAANLALFNLSLVIRLTRSGTREAMRQDYVRFARAKGLTEMRVVGVHVLRNVLVPVVTVAGVEFGSVIAFAVVTESIFAWPGMGRLLIDSINVLDRPVIVGYLCIVVTLFVAINLFVDLAYSWLDPRVRSGGARCPPRGESPPSSRRAASRSRVLCFSRWCWSPRSLRRGSRRRIPTIWRGSTCSTRACRRGRARQRARSIGWAPTPRAATCCPPSSTAFAPASPSVSRARFSAWSSA